MQLLIIMIVLVCCLFFIRSKIGSTNAIFPINSLEDDDEELLELPQEKAYYDETNKVIIELKKKLDKEGIQNENIKEVANVKKQISDGFNEWGRIQETLEEMINERTSFVTQSNFYPKEYVFDINRMRIEKEKAREYQLNNPLKASDYINQFIKEQNEKVEMYKEIKEKIELLFPKLEKYEKTLKTKKEQVNHYKKKQQLYIHLHNGELKLAKRLIKELKGKIKKL